MMGVRGAATNWDASVSNISLGPGTAVDNGMIAGSATQLSAPFSVNWDAAPGPRSVTVTTGSQVLTLSNALTIVARSRPTVALVSPNSARAGATNVTVTITGNGTRWKNADSDPGPGARTWLYLTSGTVQITPTRTVNSPTQMTAVFDIPSTAPTGPWNITIHNGGPAANTERIEIPGGFTVSP
jgi:hypothetical protein